MNTYIHNKPGNTINIISNVNPMSFTSKELAELLTNYGNMILRDISASFLNPDNLKKANLIDSPAIQAIGETIVNIPLPDINFNQYPKGS